VFALNAQQEHILLIKNDALLHHHLAHNHVEDVEDLEEAPGANNAANHNSQR